MGIGTHLGIVAQSGAGSALSNVYSLDLDGSDEHASGSGAFTSLQGLSQGSVSYWVYLNDTAATYVASQWSQTDGTSRVFAMMLSPFNTRVDVYWGPNISYRHTSLSLNTGEWYHIVTTYNDATSTAAQETLVYINGTKYIQSVGYGSPASLPSSPSTPFTIGKRGGYTGNELNGYIDEVAVFTKQLSTSEIEDIYNSGTPTDLTGHSGLANWWRCGDSDSGTGTTITDAAGSHNLTLINGPSFISIVP